jgi:hypothetical protein
MAMEIVCILPFLKCNECGKDIIIGEKMVSEGIVNKRHYHKDCWKAKQNKTTSSGKT